MPRRRNRSSTARRAVSVSFYDQLAGESISITVYPGGASIKDIATEAASALRRRWPTTDVGSRRHKRR